MGVVCPSGTAYKRIIVPGGARPWNVGRSTFVIPSWELGPWSLWGVSEPETVGGTNLQIEKSSFGSQIVLPGEATRVEIPPKSFEFA